MHRRIIVKLLSYSDGILSNDSPPPTTPPPRKFAGLLHIFMFELATIQVECKTKKNRDS